jgi:ABC-type uncharacterized transport system permease subunit
MPNSLTPQPSTTPTEMVATTTSIAAGIGAVLLYLLGAAMQLRRLSQSAPVLLKPLIAVGIPALLLHAVTAISVIYTPAGVHLGFFSTGSLVTLVMTAFVLLASLRLPVHNLFVLVFPAAALGIIGSLVGESTFTPRRAMQWELMAHVLISITAYSILFMAACQSVLLAIQEHYLRARHGLAFIRLLPPLETMETLLFSMLWTGLGVLTVAILSGFAFLEDMFAQRVAHHTVLSSLSWLLYATLLAGHKLLGWRGTTAVRWTLIAFLLLVLGYFGSKFVIEILLDA